MWIDRMVGVTLTKADLGAQLMIDALGTSRRGIAYLGNQRVTWQGKRQLQLNLIKF